jgi:predicted phosphoadenosine phosphosulfate sulfurtransferase
VEAYVSIWESRCYKDGIPDEVSSLLEKSNRVPSYRAIAVAILKNDLTLKSLGFSGKDSAWAYELKKQKQNKDEKQMGLL